MDCGRKRARPTEESSVNVVDLTVSSSLTVGKQLPLLIDLTSETSDETIEQKKTSPVPSPVPPQKRRKSCDEKKKEPCFCADYTNESDSSQCVLEAGLEDDLRKFIKMKCSGKGGCSKKCTNACRRYMCYRTSANFLHLTNREKLPECVTSFISRLYGKSVTGFDE
jgi:hypothetical protein